MIVDFKFNIGERVYYLRPSGFGRRYEIEEGEIIGFTCFKDKDDKGELDLRVNFKKYNAVPIQYVFRDKEKAENMKFEMYGKHWI